MHTPVLKDTTMQVLLDPIATAKAAFIKFIEAGKLEEIDYVMTVDFPDSVVKEDRIEFDSTSYQIMWIIPQPFQILVGLKKSLKNYDR